MAKTSASQQKASLIADTAVIGAGPAGLAAALALSAVGCKTVCSGQKFNPDPARPDTRTTALLQASVQFLKNLGVWHHCASRAAALEAIRVIDDTGRLIRAPEIEFQCRELGAEPFGYNIANTDLVAALLQVAQDAPSLELLETAKASLIATNQANLRIETAEGGGIEARLVAAADGRNSSFRAAAGIETGSWRYNQTAIACNFSHSEPHNNCSNEFHRAGGPFTSVPLPGKASSLVWVSRPDEAERLMTLDDEAIASEIERGLHGILGSVTQVGPRAHFPLAGLTPRSFARNRIALVGEAAHVIPPIGAQGLNLGFRDAAALAEHVGHALEKGSDPGDAAVMRAYNRSRRSDVLTRTAAVDLLNRSLLSELLPLQMARGAGLHLLKSIAPLRQFIMRQGVAPAQNLPPLMRSPSPAMPVSGA